MQSLFNPETIIQTLGIIGVGLIIFAESGLLIGIFFPGDSLLFTAGILGAAHLISVPLVILVSIVAAIIGDQVGYATGKVFGPKVFSRPESRWFSPRHIERANHFYSKYGKKTIILARFTPIIRTLAPLIAGIGKMEYSTFLSYNIAGGILWVSSITLLGYWLGSIIPSIDRYLLPIIILIVVVSLIPTLREIFFKKRS